VLAVRQFVRYAMLTLSILRGDALGSGCYDGGLGLATAFELIEPPLAIFIAAIPLLKMLNSPGASRPTRFVGQVLIGAAQPVGSSAEATIQLTETKRPTAHRPTILEEARQLANQARNKRLGTTS
jgi:hypothetical protein